MNVSCPWQQWHSANWITVWLCKGTEHPHISLWSNFGRMVLFAGRWKSFQAPLLKCWENSVWLSQQASSYRSARHRNLAWHRELSGQGQASNNEQNFKMAQSPSQAPTVWWSSSGVCTNSGMHWLVSAHNNWVHDITQQTSSLAGICSFALQISGSIRPDS